MLLFGLTLAEAHDSGPNRVEVRLDPGEIQVDVELDHPPFRVQTPGFWEERLDALPDSFAVTIDGAAPTAKPELHIDRRGLSPHYFARYHQQVPLAAQSLELHSGHATGPWLLVVTDRGEARTPVLMGGAQTERVGLDRVAPQRLGTTVVRFVGLGFVHILPRGLDHILFVLGLFLLADRARPLVLQVSAFTVAHTLTLGAGLLGWVQLPAAVIEPLIAASIVGVAVENLVVRELKAWRPALVFGLGLLHGLGFAGVLAELGLPPGQRLAPLLAFNVGVELGQLVVIGLAFALVGRWWGEPWYRNRVVVPGSIAIALVGAWWTFERIAWGG